MTTAPDGQVTVVLSGTMGRSIPQAVMGLPVPSPSRFAATALTLALRDAGVVVDGAPGTLTQPRAYDPGERVADHVSARLAEEAKVTLKVSQNLHASMTPFILGALVGKATKDIDVRGFALEHDMLLKAGLDLSGASQADGAGGAGVALFSPDFMARYLAWMATRPEFPAFKAALPILGRDGTLADIQTTSAGAGHVFAKTGTFDGDDLLNARSMLTAKGLAGYTTTSAGRRYAFAIYVNHVELADARDPGKVAGQALGEIASAIYAAPLDAAAP